MSAVVEELKLKNFGGYRRQDLIFTPGLNLITGRNNTGKTTILEAIIFALYGEVPEVEKRILVSRLPGADELRVYVKFRSPVTGEQVEVGRTGVLTSRGGRGAFKSAKALLTLNGREIQVRDEEDLRRRVSAFVGLSYKRFISLACVRQGELTRILRPEREQMDAVLGISLLRELKEQMEAVRRAFEKHEGQDAKTRLHALQTTLIPTLERRVEALRADADTLQAEVNALQAAVSGAESRELGILLGSIEKRELALQALRERESRIKALLSSVEARSPEELRGKISQAKERQETVNGELAARSEEARRLRESWLDLEGERRNLNAELERHRQLAESGAPNCPTCGQPIDPEHIKTVIRLDEERLKSLEAKIAEAQRLYKAVESQADGFNAEAIKLNLLLQRLLEAERAVGKELGEAAQLRERLQALKAEIHGWIRRLNLPFGPDDPELKLKLAQRFPLDPTRLKELKTQLQVKGRQLSQKREELQGATHELQTYRSQAEHLQHRIKRAGIATEVADRLERAIEEGRRRILSRVENRALSIYNEFTEQQLYSAFHIDPEDYRVYVKPKQLKAFMPATRVGGGHQTLISLALRLALLEALKFQHLLLLDEPTYGVDRENLPQLLGYISEAARHVGQVILVTHHGLGEEEASNIINVSYAEDGSSRAEIKM